MKSGKVVIVRPNPWRLLTLMPLNRTGGCCLDIWRPAAIFTKEELEKRGGWSEELQVTGKMLEVCGVCEPAAI